MELHMATQMQSRMMAATAVGAASTSSFVAVTYKYGPPVLQVRSSSLVLAALSMCPSSFCVKARLFATFAWCFLCLG